MVMVPFGKDLSRIYPERGRGVGDDKRIRHWRGGGNSGFAEHDLETRRQRRSTGFSLEEKHTGMTDFDILLGSKRAGTCLN